MKRIALLFLIVTFFTSCEETIDRYPYQDGETGLWGYKNQKGQLLIEPQYHKADDFSDGLALVKIRDNQFYINRFDEIELDPSYKRLGKFNEGLARFVSETGWGFIDKSGDIIIEPNLKKKPAHIKEGIIALKRSILTKNGKELPFITKKITENGYYLAFDNQNKKRISHIRKNDETIYVADREKEDIVYIGNEYMMKYFREIKADSSKNISAQKGYYQLLELPSLDKVIDIKIENEKYPPSIFHIDEDIIIFSLKGTGDYAFYNLKGEFLFNKKDIRIFPFSEGLAAVSRYTKTTLDDRYKTTKTTYYYGFMDTKGNMKIPFRKCENTTPFKNGLATITTSEIKEGFFSNSKIAQTWYIDTNGERVFLKSFTKKS